MTDTIYNQQVLADEFLNLNQTPEELNQIYKDDYYHYLRSDPFKRTFLKPIGDLVNWLDEPCIDVGCGEGQLSEFIDLPYLGIDGSAEAIRKASKRYEDQVFLNARFEEFPLHQSASWGFGTAVFGGIMEVLVKPEARVPLVELYRKTFGLKYLIIYDLERLDTTLIEKAYGAPHREIHAKAEGVETLEVKLSRKILLYRVSI